jgi:ethanolamine utilization protein EutN
MLLGRVIGTLVACEVYKGLEGVPMLVVQPLTKSCEPKGDPIICADSTSMAGPDELVYYEGGREAAMTLRETFVPVDHAIVGIVDDVNLARETVEN